MCSYKILFHRPSGYVVKCNSCSSYQVAYGTMVFTISTENMKSLFMQVSKMNEEQRPRENEKERFQVKLPCESVIMALNARELKRFYFMLDEAFTMEELKKVLAANNIGQ